MTNSLIEEYQDSSGTIRRLGTLIPQQGLVSSFPVFEDTIPLWDDADIKRAITDPNRVPRRKLFAADWVQNQANHGCHDDATELLTDRGWVRWQDYNWTDQIGTVSPVDGSLEFQSPTAKHVYEYSGPLYHSLNKSVAMAVTPNHRMYVRKWIESQRKLSDSYEFRTAENMGWYSGLLAAPQKWRGVDIERISIPGGPEMLGDDFVAFCAVFVSDGWIGSGESTNRVSLCCFREDRYDKVAALSHRIGLKEIPGRRGVWGKAIKPLRDWVAANCYTSQERKAPNKKIPAIIKTLCRRQLMLFLDFFGDKTHGKESGRSYYTSSKTMADDLQELLLRAGIRATLRSREPRETATMKDGRRVVSSKTCYELYERTTDELSLDRKKHIETDSYRGNVYCATVPNGTIVTRRDGTVLVSGNSCNGFAGADALGKRRFLDGLDKLLLSGAFLYSLINGGRDNGSMLEDGLRAVKEYGVAPASLVPWNQIYPNQQPREAREAAAKHKALTAYAVRTRQGLRTALAAGYPCIVVVSAGRNFDRLNSQGIAGVDGGSGNHAVHCDDLCIVGGTEVFDMQNSWGLQYGQKGRAYLTWDSFSQTFRYHTFYAIGSVREEA